MDTKQERLPLLHKERENPQREVAGLSLMVLAALLFGTLGVLVRYLTAYRGMALFTVVLVRGLTQTVLGLLTTALVPDGRETFRNTRRLWVALALRGGSGALASVALAGSYKLLDFSIASSIFYTNPVLVLLLGNVALHEPIQPRTALAALFSLIGAILVTGPFTQGAQTSTVGVVLASSAACTAALAFTTLRAVATQVHFLAPVLSLSVFTLLAGLAGGGTADLFKSASCMGIAVVTGVLGFGAQCIMSKGYEYCTAGKGALVRNIEIPLAYVLGIAFLDEVPNVVSLVGGILIFAAMLLIEYGSAEKE